MRRWNIRSSLLRARVLFYLSGLRHVPASYAGAFLPLIPVFGVTAAFLLGERLEPWQWFGAAVIVTATAFIARHESKLTQPSPTE